MHMYMYYTHTYMYMYMCMYTVLQVHVHIESHIKMSPVVDTGGQLVAMATPVSYAGVIQC